jgi:phosphoribosylglycinamide formyltransferase-1
MIESHSKLRVAVLIGGSGSNLQAMIDATQEEAQNPPLGFELIGVISHNPEAYGLIRAQKAHLPHFVVNPALFDSKQAFEHAILAILDDLKPDLICLAGFMRVLSPEFIQAYPNQIINIHPSLLPKYPGLHTHKQVIANKDTEHGATVHWVTEQLDAGPIIAQKKLAVSPDDTEESIKEKVLKLEHMLYPLVINTLALDMHKKVKQ